MILNRKNIEGLKTNIFPPGIILDIFATHK